MDSRAIARERMTSLIALARTWFVKDEKLSRRYVYLAWKIGQAHRIPSGNKEFCKQCFAPFIPSLTVKVRTGIKKEKMMSYECLSCGAKIRFGYKKKKSEKKVRLKKKK